MLTFCARAVTLLLLSILLFLIIIIFSNATISVCTSAWLETNATPIQCDLLAQALQSMMHTWLWGMGVSDVYIEENHTPRLLLSPITGFKSADTLYLRTAGLLLFSSRLAC